MDAAENPCPLPQHHRRRTVTFCYLYLARAIAHDKANRLPTVSIPLRGQERIPVPIRIAASLQPPKEEHCRWRPGAIRRAAIAISGPPSHNTARHNQAGRLLPPAPGSFTDGLPGRAQRAGSDVRSTRSLRHVGPRTGMGMPIQRSQGRR
ncbi:hypothetical protein ACJJTC_007411 [Scirpophaga incertulas]